MDLATTSEWIIFGVVVAVMLTIDVFVHRGEKAESRSRAIFIFLGAEALERWHWVEYVFAVLTFAAAKMLIPETWFEISPMASVGIIVACISIGIWASLRAGESKEAASLAAPNPRDAGENQETAPKDTVRK